MGPFPLCALNVSLPIPREIHGPAALQGQMGNPVHLIAIAHTAVIFPP
jgi:hypothetical protein